MNYLNVGIGLAFPIDQSRFDAFNSPLRLDQANPSEEFIEFVTTLLNQADSLERFKEISMALPAAKSRIPVAIGDLAVVLTDYVDTVEDPAHKSGGYEVQVIYDNGDITVLSGDLLPHITPAQVAALVAFMDGLRVQAVNEILG